MLAKEVVAAVFPYGNVVFVEAAWYICSSSLRVRMLQYAVYVASASSACGFGRPALLLSVYVVNNSQLGFLKFHIHQLSAQPAMAL